MMFSARFIAVLTAAIVAMTVYAAPESAARRSPLALHARQTQLDINDIPSQCSSTCAPITEGITTCLNAADPVRCLCTQVLVDATVACGECVVEEGSSGLTADDLEKATKDQLASCSQLGVDLDEPKISSSGSTTSSGSSSGSDSNSNSGSGSSTESNSNSNNSNNNNNNGAVSIASYSAGLAAVGLAMGLFA